MGLLSRLSRKVFHNGEFFLRWQSIHAQFFQPALTHSHGNWASSIAVIVRFVHDVGV